MLARYLLAASIALLLQACATQPPTLPGEVYTGRIAVHRDASASDPARSISGQFELSGGLSSGRLLLISPIGLTFAQARWSHPEGARGEPTDIELDANGDTRHYATLAEMTQDAVGDPLPLAAMFDWLAGRPWPGVPVTRAPDGASFDQLGWHVDTSQLVTARLIVAERAWPAPPLHVRVKLDAPDAAGSSTSNAAAAAAAP